jgi:fibronectin-binding autotransporter adhesin
MRFKNAFAAAIAVAVSAVVFSAAFQPVEAATTTYTGTFGTPATINAGDTALLNNGATVVGTGTITTDGTLQVDQTATNLSFGNKIVGTGTFSLTNTGTVSLTGSAGIARALNVNTFVSAGRLNVSQSLVVGGNGAGGFGISGGRGTLTVNGGSVDLGSNSLGLGNDGVGTATVSSGTVTSEFITIGSEGSSSGTGTLNVLGSGFVNTNRAASVGYGGNGLVGKATVSSGTWAIGTTLTVGQFATGTLDVTGGLVTSGVGVLGDGVGSNGTVTVSSGTWANDGSPFVIGNLTVGKSGTGTLTIDGGLVRVGGRLEKGSAGTINLNSGGTLQIGVGLDNGELNVAALTNNGTLVFNRSDIYDYSGVISGTGVVTKQGPNTLQLSGINSYIGPTNVDAGALLVNGELGNTAVTVNAGGLLGGFGVISGSVFVAASGTISPGYTDFGISPNALTVGSLSLAANSHTVMSILGTAPLANEYDQLVGSGAGGLTYGGNLDLLLTGSYADGTTWNLFSNFLTKNGDLADVVVTAPGDEYDGLTFTNAGGVWTSTMTANNQYLEFTQSTGNLVVVPEPSTIAMTLAGLACGGWQVVRRGRRLRQAASLSA